MLYVIISELKLLLPDRQTIARNTIKYKIAARPLSIMIKNSHLHIVHGCGSGNGPSKTSLMKYYCVSSWKETLSCILVSKLHPGP